MVRTLYRMYLYTVSVLLLVFAATATAILLGTLLSWTPLNGQSVERPTRATLTQQLAFLVIAWVIAATLGGLHYWLIRRDIRDDPGAGHGTVRSLYLNGVEAIAMLVAVPATSFALAALGSQFSGGQAGSLAAGLVAYGVFALLELERRRNPAGAGAALTLQRLHLYGVHLLLLFIATYLWLDAFSQSLVAALVGAGQLPDSCAPSTSTSTVEACYIPGFGSVEPHLGWVWAGAIAAALPIALYAYLGRGDTRSTLRQLLHFIGYGYGIVFVLVAVDRLATLLVLAAMGRASAPVDVVGQYNFVSPAAFGLVVVALYGIWLGRDALRGPVGAHTLGLTVLAITAGILAIPFWAGCGSLLYDLLESHVPAGIVITQDSWANSIALLVAGLGYVPLAVRLRQQSRALAFTTPRRGLVLALLALGTLTAAVGLAVTLFAIVTAAVGVPLDNWQETARSGGVALAIGGVLAGIYVQRAIAEGLFRSQRPVPAASPAAATERESATTQPAMRVPECTVTAVAPQNAQPPAQAVPVEGVLDDLLAGRLTRDEAAAHLRELITAGQR